ncbi:MAG: HlyD family efflux transporter periplasmic adaptor subunit [Sphingomonadales bacterium]|nr:HlyD family efflux transporter periplasmic adaptor subunit [Sphingomonadales bacterium]
MTDPDPLLDGLLGATHRPRHRGRLALLAAAGLAAVLLLRRCVEGDPSPYFTAPVQRGDITPELTLRGTLHGTGEVTVAAAEDGTVMSVPDPAVARLRGGQELVSLDTTAHTRALVADRADAAAADDRVVQAQDASRGAQQRLERFEMVWRRSGGRVPSLDEMENARAEVARTALEAATATARQTEAHQQVALDTAGIANARAYSPFAGFLMGCAVRPGQWVRAGQPLCTVVAHPEQLRLEAPISAADAARLPSRARAHVLVDGLAEMEFPARLGTIRPGEGGQTASFTLLPPEGGAPAPMPAPGRAGTVRVALPGRHDVLLVPEAALGFALPGTPRGGTAGVYVAEDDGVPRFVPVVVGVADGGRAQVLSGSLQPDDPVIIGWRH